MNIGFIGLGAMGGALARRLQQTHKLTVWDLDAAAVAEMAKAGATAAGSAAEVGRACDVVLLCLPRTSDVRKVIFGPNGLAEGLKKGSLVIDQTTGIPGETRAIAAQLAERGIGMIDAPVSGGIAGAAAGTIAIMASGPAPHLEAGTAVLKAISPNVFGCGAQVGFGQAMKLVNNILTGGLRLATLETVAMGAKLGLSLATMTDVINKGSGRNRMTKVTLQAIADGKQVNSAFFLSLMLKDINQALGLAMSCGAPMAITNVVRGLYQIGVATLGERAQLDQAFGLMESLAGTKIMSVPNPAKPTAADPGWKPRIAYVGLGVMGGALARRLMLTHKLTVYDVNGAAVNALVEKGATAAADLAALARDADVIMICVPTSAIVREVVFGKDGTSGLSAGLAPGKIIIDQTTGDPTITREIGAGLAKLGVPLVDAPVSGGPRGADAGTIAIMCGGPVDAYSKVLPILNAISPNTVYCGETGNGHVGKIVNNAVAATNRMLTYEAVAMGFKVGLSIADMNTVINASTGWNGASERILPVLGQYGKTADFQLQLMVKDLNLAAQAAADCGAPLMIPNAVRTLYQVGMQQLGPTKNLDDMAHLFEARAGIKFGEAK